MSDQNRSNRINARLSPPLAEFVARMVSVSGLYETPSEYIRDLIRREQERSAQIESVRASLIEGEASGEPQAFNVAKFKKRMR